MRLTIAEYKATIDKLAALNRRAAKRGFTGRLDITGEPVTETVTNANGFQVTQTWIEAAITGEPPVYQGWEFWAELDWTSADDLIVRAAPGAPTVDRAGLREGECDHCHTRRHRKSVYLVANRETGERVQVGSTCIKDFLGHDTRPVFISTDEAAFDEGFGCGGSMGGGLGEPQVSPLTVLAAAWGVIQVTGYRKADSDSPTKWAVSSVLFPRDARDREFAAKVAPYFDRSYAQARIILDWLLSDEFAGDGDYVANLKVAARSEYVGDRVYGLLVSAPVAWARATERQLRDQAARAELVNEWIGERKQRLIFTARVRSIRELDGDYGVTTMYVLVSDGHICKWRASHPVLGETADSTVYVLKGTVKKHDEYQGVKETVFTRCELLASSAAADEPKPEPRVPVAFDEWERHGGWTGTDPDSDYNHKLYDAMVARYEAANAADLAAWQARQDAWAKYGRSR